MSAGKRDTSTGPTLAQIQAENGLWNCLWQVALDEAYNSKDAKRRFDEISGLPERAVVEMYFGYHPEMKRWAEEHMMAGTCEAAVTELQKQLQSTHRVRAEQRAVQTLAAPEHHLAPAVELAGDWMDAYLSGPALFPSTPAEEAVKPKARKFVPVATVELVMRKKLADGARLSRIEMLALAQRELDCDRDTARKAYNNLPKEKRPSRGRPQKSAG